MIREQLYVGGLDCGEGLFAICMNADCIVLLLHTFVLINEAIVWYCSCAAYICSD